MANVQNLTALKLVTTDTTANSLVVGGATANATSGTGGIKSGPIVCTTLTSSASVAVGTSLTVTTTAVVTGDLTGGNLLSPGNVVAQGMGPHAFGSTAFTRSQVYVAGSFTAGSGGSGSAFRVSSTITGQPNEIIAGILSALTLVEPGSGTTPLVAGTYLQAPVITAGAATVSDGATLYIDAAPSGVVAGANYSLWVDAGNTRLDGNLTVGGTATITGAATLTAGVAGGASFSGAVTNLTVVNGIVTAAS